MLTVLAKEQEKGDGREAAVLLPHDVVETGPSRNEANVRNFLTDSIS